MSELDRYRNRPIPGRRPQRLTQAASAVAGAPTAGARDLSPEGLAPELIELTEDHQQAERRLANEHVRKLIDAPRSTGLQMRDDESYDLIAASAGADLLVSVRDIHMIFTTGFKPPVHALRGVTLSVQRGSIMGLLGPNGCGKTTTLSCVLGLLNPQRGSIHIDGRLVGYGGFDGKKRLYGVVLEDTRLPPFLSVAESLRLVCSMCGLDDFDAKIEFEKVTNMCEIGSVHDRRINELSKGQARRVGLAAALIGDPPLLVLDEPSSGLDVAARLEFDEVLRRLHDGKRTVIIASHFLGDVQNTCTHVGVMRDGRVKVAGPTETLLDLTEPTSKNGVKSNIFVEERFLPVLAREGVACGTCTYPGLVQVLTDKPDHLSVPMLVNSGVVPRRMEPRVSLVSVYTALINEEHEEVPS